MIAMSWSMAREIFTRARRRWDGKNLRGSAALISIRFLTAEITTASLASWSRSNCCERVENNAEVPLELIVFAEEEGTTFGMGMLGSRAMVGELTAEQLSLFRNKARESYLDAGKPYGVDPQRLTHDSAHCSA